LRNQRGRESDPTDRYDLLDVYPDVRLFQVRIVTREALNTISEALIEDSSLAR
jgi:hypothetical protein